MRRLCLLIASALMLTVAVGGVASAAGKKTAKANIQGGNYHCGANETGDPTLGTVSYKRSGTTVTVKVSLKMGAPNAKYQVALYGNECTGIAALPAPFTTNKKGVGKASGSFTVPSGDTEFFATVYQETGPGEFGVPNDTPYVMLAP